MATSFTWRLGETNCKAKDNKFIDWVMVECYGTENSVTKMYALPCHFNGTSADVGADFIAYDTLIDSNGAWTSTGEATVLNWALTNGFSAVKQEKMKGYVQKQIDDHNNVITDIAVIPTSTTAKPTVTVTPME